MDIVAVIDSRVWLPPHLPRDLERALKRELTHANPEFHRKRAMGFATWGIQSQIKTFDFRADRLGERMTLPLGAAPILRELADNAGYRVRWQDRRTSAPVDFPSFCVDPKRPERKLRWYQHEAVEAALAKQVGIIRAPTGSGKSIASLAFIQEAGERAMVVVRDGNLLKQWRRVAAACLDMTEAEIGIVGAGKWRPGDRLTIALQQTLYKNGTELAAMLNAEPFGCIVVDEVQGLAARTFLEVADHFPCKYRIGVSADECVSRGTLITMGDGTLRSVEDVRAGDFVLTPLGPRAVTAAMFKGIRETGTVTWNQGEIRCTSETWFAGPLGWHVQQEVSSVRLRDVERETLRGLRGADAEAQQSSGACAMHCQVLPLGGVFDLRRGGDAAEGKIGALAGSHWGSEGAEEVTEASCGSLCIVEGESSSVRRSGDLSDAFGCEGTSKGDATKDVRGEPGSCVRWEEVGQGASSASEGGGSGRDAGGSRIHSGVLDSDVHGLRSPLHGGSCSSAAEDRRGDRRGESQIEAGEGRGTGRNASRFGVGGTSATVDLRSWRASQRSHGDHPATLHWDGLSVPVFDLEIEGAACYYANGALVHNTRKDKKEFLIYDVMGRVIYEIERDVLEAERVVHPVTVRVVPTDFRADWYASAPAEERDFTRLLDEMVEDHDRNALILDTVEEIVAASETPALLFTRRRDHAHELADLELSASRGVPCGLLMGGTGADAERFQTDLAALLAGRLKVAAGTFDAIGVGHDLPAIRAGVAATPISSGNRQFFGQVRGRICRSAEGKDDAFLYYLLDKNVFPRQVHRLWDWNDGLLEYRRNGKWVRAKSPSEVASGDGW